MIKTINNILLCIKYPFLYPRNRFTGKNHVSYEWICKLYNKFDKKAFDTIVLGYKFYHHPNDCNICNNVLSIRNKYNIQLIGGVLYIDGGIKQEIFNLQKHVGSKFLIHGITESSTLLGNPIIIYHVSCKEYTEINYGFAHQTINILKSNLHKKLRDLTWWFWTVILDNICIIPKHTELDAMPEGWRKAFGLKMCEEIKQSLIKTGGRKLLNKYRICQIKEKFGGLRWYDNNSTKEIQNIINKYETISEYTCIDCGKSAKYRTKGWIVPLCENCVDDFNKVTKL